ncbi:unnamed protein product [Mycena citricolor]|uniref:Uncharacterized protein n=1 Tax=Mycena citricolor TaxID=2018698 RepID=A0AAD2HLJ9_9AGAR|nr:unnamed protein product [Mycena citricolor]CAK5278211.1 unnamed protein product [Mycena citricolor]
MADLTVLVSPIPLYAHQKAASSSVTSLVSSIVRSSSPSPLATRRNRAPSPIMVTLESAPLPDESAARREQMRRDIALLSPPMNTWKSPQNRHRPQRSQSAPPTQTSFRREEVEIRRTGSPVDDAIFRPQQFPPGLIPDTSRINGIGSRQTPRRSVTAGHGGYAYVAEGGMTMRGGELVRPPPPLLRPSPFWRRAHRSALTPPAYAPASHLVRRSTFIAAGLPLDAPGHDARALCVESRLTGEDGVRSGAKRVIEVPGSEWMGLGV